MRPRSAGSPTTSPRLRTTRGYERFLEWGRQVLGRTPVVGGPIYGTLHGVKKGFKDIVAPQGMFEDLGLKYVGPVDGHDVVAVEHALRQGAGVRRAGHRARADPQGPWLRPGRERRGRPVPRRRRDRPRDRPAGNVGRTDLGRRSSPRRSWRSRGAPGRGRHHRRDAASRSGSHPFERGLPGPGLRRRHRRAARGDVRGRHGARPGCTRSSRSTRRSSTAPSTRS